MMFCRCLRLFRKKNVYLFSNKNYELKILQILFDKTFKGAEKSVVIMEIQHLKLH